MPRPMTKAREQTNNHVYAAPLSDKPKTALLELLHNACRTFLTHETLSAPTPSYLMIRDSAARPAPDRFMAGEEFRILL